MINMSKLQINLATDIISSLQKLHPEDRKKSSYSPKKEKVLGVDFGILKKEEEEKKKFAS